MGQQGSECNSAHPGQTSILYLGDREGHVSDIYEALVTCPNITTLELEFISQGCGVPNQKWTLDFNDGDKLPHLKTLKLKNMDFVDTWTENPIRNSLLFQAQAKLGTLIPLLTPNDLKPPLDKRLRTIDFSKLEDLDLEENSFLFSRMLNEFRGLRKLTLSSSAQSTDEIQDFFEGLPTPKHLTIGAGYPPRCVHNGSEKEEAFFPADAVLARHGPILKHLVLRQAETDFVGFPRGAMFLSQTEAIGNNCSELPHLSVDLGRNETWTNATLDSITSIRQLRTLGLTVEIGKNLHRHDPGEYGCNS